MAHEHSTIYMKEKYQHFQMPFLQYMYTELRNWTEVHHFLALYIDLAKNKCNNFLNKYYE